MIAGQGIGRVLAQQGKKFGQRRAGVSFFECEQGSLVVPEFREAILGVGPGMITRMGGRRGGDVAERLETLERFGRYRRWRRGGRRFITRQEFMQLIIKLRRYGRVLADQIGLFTWVGFEVIQFRSGRGNEFVFALAQGA